jgi:hypothetical protein
MLRDEVLLCHIFTAEIADIVARHITLLITFQLQDQVRTPSSISSLFPFRLSRSRLTRGHHNGFLLICPELFEQRLSLQFSICTIFLVYVGMILQRDAAPFGKCFRVSKALEPRRFRFQYG